MRRFLFLLVVAGAALVSASAQTSGSGYYRLVNKALGDSLSIDIVNDGVNTQIRMATTDVRSGQHWLFTAIGNGFFRLTTQWQGTGRSLDVVNDGVNRSVQLAPSGTVSGQHWKLTPVEPGVYRLTTQWLGESRSLAVIRSGSNVLLQLADTSKSDNQLWRIVSVPVTRESLLSGFRVHVNQSIADTDQGRAAVAVLSKRLQQITTLISPTHVAALQKVPIWVEYKHMDEGGMWYHPARDWLLKNGYPATMEKSVEIKNVANFLAWQADQPMMVLHEFAHAFQDLYMPHLRTALVAAFDSAVRSGKYESVPYVRGGNRRAYALDNRTEYFAELTEAYFGRNDYFPFTRDELRTFDPAGYKLVQDAWK